MLLHYLSEQVFYFKKVLQYKGLHSIFMFCYSIIIGIFFTSLYVLLFKPLSRPTHRKGTPAAKH